MEERWNEIVHIWKTNGWMVWVFGGLGLFTAGIVVGIGFYSEQSDWLITFAEEFRTEIIGILVTVFIIDRIYALNSLRERKNLLFNQIKSRVNEISVGALEEIRREGWLEEALQYYQTSKTEQPYLERLQWQGAFLRGIKLIDVDLRNSNLMGADLMNADLRGCDLAFCDLTDALLINTDLRGADLYLARLKVNHGVYQDNEPSILPDGTLFSRFVNTNEDLRRFTDDQHQSYRATRDAINQLRSDMGMRPLRE